MRFTSLIVELVRARPRLIFWIAVLAQAVLWFIVPTILYGSPPGDTATILAVGREYQVGTQLGPPAAFWLADIAFRLSGNHIFGVYLLSQVCFVVTFWALFQLGRAIVGGQQAVLAVLLTATITAFSFPGIEFGPLTLAKPLWALVLLHSWQVIGQGKRSAWFALSIEAGMLLLTTMAAIPLLIMLAIFALATKKGRHALASTDPVFALMVVMVIVLPYVVWLERGAAVILPPLPQLSDLEERLIHWGQMLAGLVFALLGVALLLVFNSRRLNGKPEDAPIVYRPGVAPTGRLFIYVFTIAPVLVLSFVAALLGVDKVIGGDGIALLLVGLAVIVTASDLIYLRRQHVLRSVWLAIMAAPVVVVLAVAFIQPWAGTGEIKTSLPASDIGKFFGENFERRTGHPLAAVAGDPQLAMLIGFAAPGRPHVLLDATPKQTPWMTFASFNQTGGVVVWRASDTVGTPPDDLVKRFPGLVPEVPRTFERLVNGRQPQLRIGWAIVRPQAVPAAR